MAVLGRIVIIAVLLLLNGYFVGAEFALVRSRRTRLEAMARGGDRLARLALRAIANIGRLLSATQLGITVVSLAIGALAEESLAAAFSHWLGTIPFAARIAGGLALGSVIAITIVSYFHVVFGELAPKSLALAHPESLARVLAPPLVLFELITRPFNALLTRSAQFLLRSAGVKQPSMEEAFHSPEELRMLVEQSTEGGALEQTDATLLEGVFEFSEKNAREVMTPRTEIDALAVDATLDETLALVEETRRSRYPVYEETIDDIIGLVLAKDLIPVLRHQPGN
ncbi:MAG: HlyC/CorC family transporter, partial [Betaproteobacteria bacterium]